MRTASFLVTALSLLTACSHTTPEVKAPAAPPAAAHPATAAPVAASPSCTGDEQCAASKLCAGARCVPITAGLAECRASAHFEFDRADLRHEDLPRLRRLARCLIALSVERALVEGNCDERGTVQYNVALGFRRAHAVAKYVSDMGVAPERLSEVSYGKELPSCADATEACWMMNRRADATIGGTPRDVTAMVRDSERRERGRASTAKQAAAVQSSGGAR